MARKRKVLPPTTPLSQK